MSALNQVAKQDSMRGDGTLSRHVILADAGGGRTLMVELDANGGYLRISQVDGTGAPDPDMPTITLDVNSLRGLGLTSPVAATFRRHLWRDTDTCDLWGAAFLMTAPERVAP